MGRLVATAWGEERSGPDAVHAGPSPKRGRQLVGTHNHGKLTDDIDGIMDLGTSMCAAVARIYSRETREGW
jgi:hypothetical protein